MKHMKRSNIYKASNVTFDPTTIKAYSYSWWCFVAKVEDKVVFNNYRYSTSTSKHQAKVRRLLEQLGIKIDLELPLPDGILQASEIRYRSGTLVQGKTLAEMIVAAEEHLCDAFLEEQIKKQERYQKQKQRKLAAKLETYLEQQLAFRDYDIKSKDMYGSLSSIVGVHQQVDADSLEQDVENALHSFYRDGFGKVVFYV